MNVKLLARSKPLSTVEWCEKNIYLSSRIPTSEPGQWQRKNVMALARPGGPIEALDDPSVETVVVEKGAQTALTTTGYSWLVKNMDTDPASALIVMNSVVDAREKSSETFRPLIEDSPRLQELLPKNRRRDWTKLYQLINGRPIYWVGANSPGRLGGKPIRRLFLDEVDKYPLQTKREAGAAALARQRTKSFKKKGLAKIFEISTPTSETGEVHQEYQTGDQRQLEVPCPHCGQMQVMVWAQFKIDMFLAKTDPSKAVQECHYECPHCKGKWSDEDRWAAIAKGEWKATTQPVDPKCRSFRLPSWTSTFVTHAYLAAQWLRAQKSTNALQDFLNSEAAEPFADYQNIIRDEIFAELEGFYAADEMWINFSPYRETYADRIEEPYIFAGVDVQKDYLVAVIRCFILGGESGLIWAGTVTDFPTLEKLMDKHDVQFVLVDSRHRTQEVNEWCGTHPGYIPTQGVTRTAASLYSINQLDIDMGTRRQGMGRVVEFISFTPDTLKDILATQIQRSLGSKTWLIPQGYAGNDSYCRQMSAERCINGKWQCIPAGRANHFWDAECLALLAAIRFQVWQFTTYETNEENSNATEGEGQVS